METNIPLDFFTQQLFLDGHKEIMKAFIDDTSLKLKGYRYSTEHDCYVLEVIYGTDPNNPIFEYDEINRTDYYKAIVIKNIHDLFNYITYNQVHLIEILDKLKIFYNKAITNDSIHSNCISEQLYNLITDLRIAYPTLKHTAFNLLNKSKREGAFFQYKELSPKFFEELYNALIKLDLIDDVDTTEEMVFNIFTCGRPTEDLKLAFIKPNSIIAYFLKQIEVFFDNLNAVTIEQSKCFYNKQGKVINSADLYTSLSRSNEKNKDYYNKINSYITHLKIRLKD